MKNCIGPENQTTRGTLLVASVTALAVVFTVGGLQTAQAHQDSRPPRVPANIQVPAGNKLFFDGHAVGSQNYSCLPSAMSATGFAWTLFGPQATLFDDDDKQVITHFLSANPFEAGTARATWQHSRDTSSVWAMMVPGALSTDPNFVAPGAIPWLLLQVVGAQVGPDGGRKLLPTTYIQRLNTGGGIAPATGCSAAGDVGKKALVPYTADYFFYRLPGWGDDN